MLSCTLLVLMPAAQAQIPFASGDNTATTARSKPWWDLAQAERCGRLWCSQVLIPYITLGEDNRKFVVAVAAEADAAESDLRRTVKRRSETIVQSFNAVLSQLKRSLGSHTQSKRTDPAARDPQIKRSLQFWLISTPKPLHPRTPSIDIGKLNNATVVYVLANEKLEISQQILATVTDTDAQHAGLSKDDLAAQWKKDLQSSFSTAIWGLEFNRTFPLARPLLALAVLGVSFAVALLLTKLRRFFRRWLRTIQARLDAQDELAKRAAMAGSDFPEQGPPVPPTHDPAEPLPRMDCPQRESRLREPIFAGSPGQSGGGGHGAASISAGGSLSPSTHWQGVKISSPNRSQNLKSISGFCFARSRVA
ncbi:MAG: hypothetical protein HQ527_10050 [Cyanobacteria bacterium]|nr:hypothetical protein [Cyanobacteria bacterium bin.51]